VNELLSLENISHSFSDNLFKDISLKLSTNKKVAIIGESGCGKSTLLHIMATFLKPQFGIVKLFDKDIYSLNDKKIMNYRRHDISVVFQQHYLFKGFLLEENLKIASLISGNKIDIDLIEKFGLKNKTSLHTSALSGGEQQRASILRALIKRPKIIFADEPTGNLDYKNSHITIDALFEYIDDTQSSIILITHDKKIADRCDEVYEINNQRLTLIR
jgi:putative ABC transport system ATP-binding protein